MASDRKRFEAFFMWGERRRHLADGLSKAGSTVGQIEKALGGNLMRVYGDTFD
jgi:hypothetical protein